VNTGMQTVQVAVNKNRESERISHVLCLLLPGEPAIESALNSDRL
jgi:hypothetical protein